MKIIVRTYDSGKIEWWVLNRNGFAMACGIAPTRRAAYIRGRSAADQFAAEIRDGFSLPDPSPLT